MTLDELKAMVRTGWKVDIRDHDYLNDSGTGTVGPLLDVVPHHDRGTGGFMIKLGAPLASQGRKFTERAFTWPVEGDEKYGYEIEEGKYGSVKLHIRRRRATSRAGANHLSVTYTFNAPEER